MKKLGNFNQMNMVIAKRAKSKSKILLVAISAVLCTLTMSQTEVSAMFSRSRVITTGTTTNNTTSSSNSSSAKNDKLKKERLIIVNQAIENFKNAREDLCKAFCSIYKSVKGGIQNAPDDVKKFYNNAQKTHSQAILDFANVVQVMPFNEICLLEKWGAINTFYGYTIFRKLGDANYFVKLINFLNEKTRVMNGQTEDLLHILDSLSNQHVQPQPEESSQFKPVKPSDPINIPENNNRF